MTIELKRLDIQPELRRVNAQPELLRARDTMLKDEIIYVGNTYSLAYLSQLPDGTPFNPSNAYAELVEYASQEFIEIGMLGNNGSGAACKIEGNQISFTLSASHTQNPMRYKLFVTAVYNDGQTVSNFVHLRVKAKSQLVNSEHF